MNKHIFKTFTLRTQRSIRTDFGLFQEVKNADFPGKTCSKRFEPAPKRPLWTSGKVLLSAVCSPSSESIAPVVRAPTNNNDDNNTIKRWYRKKKRLKIGSKRI